MNDLDTVPDARTIAARIASSRRGLLCGVAGLSAAAVLSACGGGEDDADPGDEPTGDDDPTQGDDDTGDDGGDGDGLAAVADIPVGGGIAVGGVILTQPVEGTIRAFDPTCTHQGATVEPPVDGIMTCPLHGSQFSAEDGSVVNPPATLGLTEVPVTVTDGQVFKET